MPDQRSRPSLPRPDALHTVDQAAEVLGVPAAAIRRWRRAGKAMPAGMLRAAVPSGLQPLFHLEELGHLAAAYHRRSGREYSVVHEDDARLPGEPAAGASDALNEVHAALVGGQ